MNPGSRLKDHRKFLLLTVPVQSPSGTFGSFSNSTCLLFLWRPAGHLRQLFWGKALVFQAAGPFP